MDLRSQISAGKRFRVLEALGPSCPSIYINKSTYVIIRDAEGLSVQVQVQDDKKELWRELRAHEDEDAFGFS